MQEKEGEATTRRNNKHWAESYTPACERSVAIIFTPRKLRLQCAK